MCVHDVLRQARFHADPVRREPARFRSLLNSPGARAPDPAQERDVDGMPRNTSLDRKRWVEILARYGVADARRSVRELCLTLAPFVLLWALMLFSLERFGYWACLPLAIPARGRHLPRRAGESALELMERLLLGPPAPGLDEIDHRLGLGETDALVEKRPPGGLPGSGRSQQWSAIRGL